MEYGDPHRALRFGCSLTSSIYGKEYVLATIPNEVRVVSAIATRVDQKRYRPRPSTTVGLP